MNFTTSRTAPSTATTAGVTDQHNALRVTPGDDADASACDEFHVPVDPERAPARPHRLLRHRGRSSSTCPSATSACRSTARGAWSPPTPAEPPDGGWERAATAGVPRGAGGEFLLADGDEPPNGHARRARSRPRAPAAPLAAVATLCELDPRPLRVPPGRDLRRLDGRATCSTAGAGVCQDFVHLGARAAAPRTGSPPATSRATCGPRPRTAATRLGRGRHPRLAGGAAARRRTAASRSGSAPTRPTAAWPARRHVKIGHGRVYADVPPIKGVYRGPAPRPSTTSTCRMTRVD